MKKFQIFELILSGGKMRLKMALRTAALNKSHFSNHFISQLFYLKIMKKFLLFTLISSAFYEKISNF